MVSVEKWGKKNLGHGTRRKVPQGTLPENRLPTGILLEKYLKAKVAGVQAHRA